MKKNIFILATAIAIALTGCSDDELLKEAGIPVKTGDEISFGSTVTGEKNTIGTRTIYGERTTSGIPVYWEKNGSDTIAIYCKEASAPTSKLVNYQVFPSDSNYAYSSRVIKISHDEIGLQWGNSNVHNFYAIYPASIVKATDADDKQGIITASLPVNQQPEEWRMELNRNNNTRTYRGVPNMDYAVMFAYSQVKKDEITAQHPINLQFQNLVTVVDITIPGSGKDSVTINNITVGVAEGKNTSIVGDFDIFIPQNDPSNIKAICQPKQNQTVTNRISISGFDKHNNKFIKLGPNDTINVKAYLIPDTDAPIQPQTLKIAVSTLNGRIKQKLLRKAQITPHKINRVLLPNATNSGDPSYWMSSLDSTIYLTELSIPGSKMSYATRGNNASIIYQNKSIKEQFEDGIRAFIVQTGAKCEYTKEGWFNPTYTFSKCTGMPEFYTKKDLKETIATIGEQLKGTKETAIIVLTCMASEVHSNIKDPLKAWIQSVEYYIKELAKDQTRYPIYTGRITNETTLDDVQGKIIIKVNYNNEDQEKFINNNSEIPALFSLWVAPNGDTEENLAPTSNLRWGSPSNTDNQMKWMCQEATAVGNNGEISEVNKKRAIEYIFRQGIKEYKNNENNHNMWFMNDLGGYYTNRSNSTTLLAEDMNMIAVEHLQNRKENAATGLVFMNFADRAKDSGANYKSDYIIATIIDNNFKFALRKKGSN